MKHTELDQYLTAYLGQMCIHPTARELELLVRHINLVLEANRRVNLTRITDVKSAARLHTADSLAVLADVAASPAGTLLDLGTGAGFPGIPLAIGSERPVLLLDSVAKKIRELEWIIGELGLSTRVQATAGRAEALGRTRPGEFAVVTARAVSELPALVELASPLLGHGGRLICLKGTPEAAEVDRATRVGDVVGLELECERAFDLPEDAGHRTVLCYRKVGEAKVSLPRREGLAQHSPLA